MGVNWTDEQQKVIDLRNRNILVSAAAGSGKTAVLVERIIKRITEDNPPIDIDKILVVTFTKAAAAEMRERISKAIENKKEENPEDTNLEKQAALIHNAQISTIDSFCLYIVRNHFGEINLDPNFRIADTGEIKLIENDVMDELFEHCYKSEDNEAFLSLIDRYSNSRNDSDVREMVLSIYNMACSDSWPKEWIDSIGKLYEVNSADELVKSDFISSIVKDSIRLLHEYREKLGDLYNYAQANVGLEKYCSLIAEDMESLDSLDDNISFDELADFINGIRMKSAPGGKSKADPTVREYIKNQRNIIKEGIKDLINDYFLKSSHDLFEQIEVQKPLVFELIRISKLYYDFMEKKKREMHIADFSDIEHFALKILMDEKTKELTSTAKEFREQFVEIMIDEYQDSNQVQEDIMRAISRESIGTNNLFMVGDVKQSIYRFRMARPELFMDKYQKYTLYTDGESDNQRIDLHKNFRSRNTVLDFTNDIFYKIMQMDMGKVSYDDEAALYEGAVYPEAKGMDAELLLVDMADEEISDIVQNDSESTRQIEALMVANKIQDIVGKQYITDKKTGELRFAKYSDIVILLRSISGDGTTFAKVLGECGIPAFVELSTGYFSAYEIQVILNFLNILDNPYQDIPMATVLKSPIVGLDEEELAQIRVDNKEVSFCEAVLLEMNKEDSILTEFGMMYKNLRATVKDTPIHILIENILETTDFFNYASAMPAGNRRKQNINMLLEKAIDYEKTSYKGLFHFVRYIEALRKYDIDFGEADITGEKDNVVRIMTIHKSKGLEFPIAIVGGLGKKFNMRDADGKMVLHSDYGIGLKSVSLNPKRLSDSITRVEISKQIRQESLGEELRVLYVALTRAKEKLILSGTISNAEKKLPKYSGNAKENTPISYGQRTDASCYLDWIIPALLSYPDKYTINFIPATELAEREAMSMAKDEISKIELIEKIKDIDDNLISEISKSFDFEYKYAGDSSKKSKYSVSELKHDSMVAKYEASLNDAQRPDFLIENKDYYIPAFAYNEENTDISNDKMFADVNPGALRGTAVHRVMECLAFEKIADLDNSNSDEIAEFVESEINRMFAAGLITEQMKDLIIVSRIEKFVSSDIAFRMSMAAKEGNLYKERPFVMKHEGGFLVQGIIDVFWIEGNNIIVLDYKTDNVNESNELVLRYDTQLKLYADALKRVYSNNENEYLASERLIYSFKLQEVVKL